MDRILVLFSSVVLLGANVGCSGHTSAGPDGGVIDQGNDAAGGPEANAPDEGSPDEANAEAGGDDGGNPPSTDGSPVGACSVPDVHVAQPSACGMVQGYPADAAPTSCTTDADCPDAGAGLISGPTLRCLHGMCTASECATNDDCPNGGVCSCQDSTFGYAHKSVGNVCVPASCRSDADCPAGGYCSPTLQGGPFYGIQGYYCHSCADECTNDRDCGDGGCSYCAYDPTVGHWACSHVCAAG